MVSCGLIVAREPNEFHLSVIQKANDNDGLPLQQDDQLQQQADEAGIFHAYCAVMHSLLPALAVDGLSANHAATSSALMSSIAQDLLLSDANAVATKQVCGIVQSAFPHFTTLHVSLCAIRCS